MATNMMLTPAIQMFTILTLLLKIPQKLDDYIIQLLDWIIKHQIIYFSGEYVKHRCHRN